MTKRKLQLIMVDNTMAVSVDHRAALKAVVENLSLTGQEEIQPPQHPALPVHVRNATAHDGM
eukprot:477994-Pelagomonas_calceolata.AAC.1